MHFRICRKYLQSLTYTFDVLHPLTLCANKCNTTITPLSSSYIIPLQSFTFLNFISIVSNFRCSHCNLLKLPQSNSEANIPNNSQLHDHFASTSRSCQTTPMGIPESPPPSYEKITFFALNIVETATSIMGMSQYPENSRPGNLVSSFILSEKCQ